ncbi:MAG: winged helix-turn-helix transcriptional regulator [Patescibacteria group bacterium]|nr:winged helix-turn-helix domain-containing protein [Patescibacteria group bacterium]MDE1966403.1 winged helix-turn-helix transcriptional regulator [Patescibacteria group bacterium]
MESPTAVAGSAADTDAKACLIRVLTRGGHRLELDSNQHSLFVDGFQVRIEPSPCRILEFLALRKGTVATKEMILDHLYGGIDEPESKIIDVFVCKLRKALAAVLGGEEVIETVWGRGYVLRTAVDAA